MTERRIDTEVWCHPDFQGLSPGAKLLYLYSWSNAHCNAAGIYRLSIETMAFETALPVAEVPKYLDELKPLDVEWMNGQKTMWVKKFLKHQSRAPKFLVAVAKALGQISDDTLVRGYLKYNNTVSIPYQYPPDTVSIPPARDSDSDKIRLSKDSDKTQTQYKGVDIPFLDSLKPRFPGIDIPTEWEDCQTWYKEHHKKLKAPQSALKNWLKNAAKRTVNHERVPAAGYTDPATLFND